MTTAFSSLPIVDVGHFGSPTVSLEDQAALSRRLYEVFSTTGFAYLTNVPLSFQHEDVFRISREFFAMPDAQKMKLAKRSFRKENKNTYRGSISSSCAPRYFCY